MQIILTQDEIDTALRETILSQITIREDQKIHIRIEPTDDGHIAVIDVLKADEAPQTSGGNSGGSKPKTDTKPKTTRGPNKAAAAAATVAADVKEDETEQVDSSAGDATWLDGTGNTAETAVDAHEADRNTTVAEVVAEAATQEAPAVQHNALKIFPDAGTSAPAMQKAQEPAAAAKSLFANLTKPTNTH